MRIHYHVCRYVYRIAGYFRGMPIFVIFMTQRKTRNFPPPKITTPPKETVTCAAQEARPSVASERMALFRYQFVQLMPMTVIPSTLSQLLQQTGQYGYHFLAGTIVLLQYVPPICGSPSHTTKCCTPSPSIAPRGLLKCMIKVHRSITS